VYDMCLKYVLSAQYCTCMPVMEDAEDDVWLFICMWLSCALVTA
jgi:hypothetical protein